MDLLSIFQTLWRYKKLTIPVLVLSVLAAGYVAKLKPPVYETQASVLLTNPPSGATSSQIAANPTLKKASPYNTFVSYGELTVVANAVMDLITSPTAQPALAGSGVDPRYQLALSSDFGNPPIIDITGVGGKPQQAIQSASVLTATVQKDLYQIQKNEGVNPFYMITAVELVKPSQAQRSSSGVLRSLIAVLAVGIILLFVVVSGAEAVEKRRRSARPKNNGMRARTSETTEMDYEAMNNDHEAIKGTPNYMSDPAAWQTGNVHMAQRPHEYPDGPRYPRA